MTMIANTQQATPTTPSTIQPKIGIQQMHVAAPQKMERTIPLLTWFLTKGDVFSGEIKRPKSQRSPM
jgi:hypothetical protein